MQLSIIIVNYNVKYFLEQCLFSVIKACRTLDAEIFVVDNCSTDGSREWLEAKFTTVCFRWNNVNLGFSKASNSVLAEAKGDHVLFLNPDTIVAEDSLEKCLLFFAATPRCGALGVRMLDGQGMFLKESKRSFPSASFSFFKLSGLAALFPASKLFAGYYAGHLEDNKDHEVDALSGAFMMMNRKAINTTSGFDEAFFMYGEDIDLSYRVQQAGFQNWFFAGTTIIHFKGESTQKLSAGYASHFYGAMKLFVQKHYNRNKTKKFLLHASIPIAKTLGTIKQKAFRRGNLPRQAYQPITVAIIAGQARFEEVLQLIKYAAVPLVVCGRISIDRHDEDFCLGNVSKLATLVKAENIQQLIFCEGEMTFKEIILQLSNRTPDVDCFFTALGSGCIVGSPDKNAKGFFIAKPYQH